MTDDDLDYGAATRAYYEAEARGGLRTVQRGLRVRFREAFIALLAAEVRASVVDFGSGPGHDGAGFVAAGLRYVGIDLAVGNGRLAAANGITVVPGSVVEPPLRDGSFSAAWSMSTLMHLPADAAASAIDAMARVLEPGAPMWIGLWGSTSEAAEMHIDDKIEGERRPYYRRPLGENRAMFEAVATVEHVETHDLDFGRYQLFHLRR